MRNMKKLQPCVAKNDQQDTKREISWSHDLKSFKKIFWSAIHFLCYYFGLTISKNGIYYFKTLNVLKSEKPRKESFCWIVWSTFSLLKSPSQRYYLLSKHKQESKCTYQNLWNTAFRTIDKNKCVYVQKHRQAFPYLFRILQLSTVSLLVSHTEHSCREFTKDSEDSFNA